MKGKQYRDWLGGIGGLFFTAALALRIFAPFGVREVNMQEVSAHVAENLDLAPQDKLPQALAEMSAYLTEHFRDKKDKNFGFAQIYAQIANDLEEYHNIKIGSDVHNANSVTEATAEPAQIQTTTFAKPELKKTDPASLPRPGSYQDLAAATKGTATLGVGA